MTEKAKHELVELLVRKAFDPVLAAPAGKLSGPDQERLAHVQHATRAEIKRFRDYSTAEDVVANFKRDLTSAAAKKIHAELARLHLPTLHHVRAEFDARADALGVHPAK